MSVLTYPLKIPTIPGCHLHLIPKLRLKKTDGIFLKFYSTNHINRLWSILPAIKMVEQATLSSTNKKVNKSFNFRILPFTILDII